MKQLSKLSTWRIPRPRLRHFNRLTPQAMKIPHPGDQSNESFEYQMCLSTTLTKNKRNEHLRAFE